MWQSLMPAEMPSQLVMPATVQEGEYPLRPFDLLWNSVPNPSFVYRFEARLDPEVLRESLAKALDSFPLLAGRIVEGKTATDPMRVVLGPGMGVSFEFQPQTSPRRRLSSQRRAAGRWVRGILAGVARKSDTGKDQQEQAEEQEEDVEQGDAEREPLWTPRLYPSGQEALLFPHEPLLGFGPLVSAKLTHSRDGKTSTLGIGFVHATADAGSILSFVQTWSHLAGVEAGLAEPMPVNAPPPPPMDRAYHVDKEALDANVERQDPRKGRNSPLDLVGVAARMLPSANLDKTCDLAVTMADLADLKNRAHADFKEGEWASSYEVLCAVLMRAMAASQSGSAKSSAPINMRCIINTRKRGEMCDANYFGNGVHVLPVPLESEDLLGDKWLARTTLATHNKMRAALNDPLELDSLTYQLEAGMRNGMLSTYYGRLRWTKLYTDNVVSENTAMVNSWLPFDWRAVDFGCGTRSSELYVARTWTHRKYFFMFPRSDDELVIRVQLGRSRLKGYLRELEATGLRFKVL